MSRQAREVAADWLMVLGALVLLASLFLPWSHQYTHAFARTFGAPALRGVPLDPTAWQVYSAADVVLAALAGWQLVMALWGSRRSRIGALGATLLAMAFVVHALGSPPTDGVNLVSPPAGRAPPPNRPDAGAGETVALAALVIAAAGLALSLAAD